MATFAYIIVIIIGYKLQNKENMSMKLAFNKIANFLKSPIN